MDLIYTLVFIVTMGSITVMTPIIAPAISARIRKFKAQRERRKLKKEVGL